MARSRSKAWYEKRRLRLLTDPRVQEHAARAREIFRSSKSAAAYVATADKLRAERKHGRELENLAQLRAARREERKQSLENEVWDDLEQRRPVDKNAAVELIYTSVAEPHYKPEKK